MSYNSASLKHVILNGDVYAVCLQHALSNEKEEIMGLLIGEVDEPNLTSYISSCVILHRLDKQADRVEISPEQLCQASEHAELLQQRLKRPMRVLGWYHSHPHITVWPSHVDVRTQLNYQVMDPHFVGLIFSVYQTDTNANINKIEVTCFQAQNVIEERVEIPLTIIPSPLNECNLDAVTNLPRILTSEIEQSSELYKNDAKDELTILHNSSLETLKMTHIISKISVPMYSQLVQRRLQDLNTRIAHLQALKKELLAEQERVV